MRRRATVIVLPASSKSIESAKLRESNFSAARAARAGEQLPALMALIDPKQLTRQLILEMLAKALPEYAIVAVSTCEELLEMRGRPPGAPHLVIIHTRSAQLTDTWVQNTLELVRLHLTDAPVVFLSDRNDVDDVVNALIATFPLRTTLCITGHSSSLETPSSVER